MSAPLSRLLPCCYHCYAADLEVNDV
eukprot:SAG11_NODE_36661_length_260_cov_1.086957_1_plen_25_part_01